ncbi:MAG TPA: type II toxin-antitoxin system HicA family toxin [Alphaproteobacteria bacterium]|nr:type II toxin-antitoxin system HicA family toxin [Alphaproteobacteria bacterium]
MGSGGLKTLEQMRNNPRNNWNIADFEKVCSALADYGVMMRPPARGSHYKVTCDGIDDILTVPARRPIKPIYVKRFVSMMDSIIERAKNEENGGQSAA